MADPKTDSFVRSDVEVGVLSHVGMVRAENQDHYAFIEPGDDAAFGRKGRLLVVCDGMGGHSGGTVASHLTVDAVAESFEGNEGTDLETILEAAIRHANHTVRARGEAERELRDMGTTCVAVVQRGATLQVANIGDSRAYLLRRGVVRQLTLDHTYLSELVAAGLLTPEGAEDHPDRNVITRCIGMGDDLVIDQFTMPVEDGDCLLLCSDGLFNHVADEEIAGQVADREPQAAAQALIDLANERGGEDNITVGLLRILRVSGAADAPSAAAASGAGPVEGGAEAMPSQSPPSPGKAAAPTSAKGRPASDLSSQPGAGSDLRPRRRFDPLTVGVLGATVVLLILLQVLIRHF